MIVLGVDMTRARTRSGRSLRRPGELLGDKTVEVGTRGFAAALGWARPGTERVWALEDCRHVSGALERFLLARGERVVRVATRLMAGERAGSNYGMAAWSHAGSGRGLR